MFEAFRVPATNFPPPLLIVAAPAQMLGYEITEALEGQGDVIGGISSPAGYQPLLGVHQSHTIEKGIF